MDIEKEINRFFNKLCLEYAICDPFYNYEYFVAQEYYEVNDFVREIFLYEGLDPEIDISLFRKVKQIFVEQLGSTKIHKSEKE